MRGVSDNALVQIADLNCDLTVGVSERAEIPEMTITANPDRRAFRNVAAIRCAEPFVEFVRITANVSLDRARHLKIAALL